MYIVILGLWERVDEIVADQNTTDDTLDLELTIFFFQAAKKKNREFDVDEITERGSKSRLITYLIEAVPSLCT